MFRNKNYLRPKRPTGAGPPRNENLNYPKFEYFIGDSSNFFTTDFNSSIASDNTLKSSINFNTKDFIETFYTPENSTNSSSKS